ncbi:MAG: Ig domain-containing protein, partial [Pseudomonadota bacterium]
MKKRNSQLIKKWIWVLSALLILPTIAFASPTFFNANLAPAATEVVGSIPDQNNEIGDSIDLTIVLTDAVTYSAAPLPTNINFNTANGEFSGSPSAAEDVTVIVSAQNMTGTVIGTDSFQWTVVAPPPVNNDPTIDNPGTQITTKNESVSLFIQADDDDIADTLTYSAQNLPNNLSINPNTGEISGKTNNTGSSSVTVKVTDGNGGEAEANFNWVVKQASVVGNPGVSVFGDVVDGSEENMVINLSDWVRAGAKKVELDVTQFSFHAKTSNVPITPF